MYDVIIGLEIHAELKTKTKMFCSCRNEPNAARPNINICPICLGHPGTLPVPNKQAIEWTILVGSALHCSISQLSKFDRKNYFYPDLPKGYQISQYDLPFCFAGWLEVDGEKIAITRIHLEEDTAKLTHPAGKLYSLVDFNRAGAPLIEMVTEPVIKTAQQAKKFCQIYQQILRYLDISNADMEKGEMRCEANVSLQEKGRWSYEAGTGQTAGEIKPRGDYQLNPKVELKNINSFRAIEKAIAYEIKRQKQKLEKGEKLSQETRGWDNNQGKTVRQRSKETSADYRYFPEPDIPPLRFSGQWLEKIKAGLIELPPEKKTRFIEQYGFEPNSAEILVSEKHLADFTEQVISELRAQFRANNKNWEKAGKKIAKLTANWILSELFKHLKASKTAINKSKIKPAEFAQLLTLIYENKVNSSAGQKILETMYQQGGQPAEIMKNLGLEQIDDENALRQIIKEIISKNPKQVEQYRGGKEAVLQFFVGQVMAASKGKANPQKAIAILKELLKT